MFSRRRAGALLGAVLAMTALAVPSSFAADVVIGSVNPVTGQPTLFTDLLKTRFPDGGPITHLYLAARGGDASNGYALVRAGTLFSGACHSEAIAVGQVGHSLFVHAVPIPLFGCEEIDDRCGSGGGVALCMPNNLMTTCQCKPPFAAGPGPGPKCEKVLELGWTLSLEDILQAN